VPETPPIERLHRHLRTWLGRWPGTGRLDVVGAVARERPGWDGRVFPAIGVRSPTSGVLSVPPPAEATVRRALDHAARALDHAARARDHSSADLEPLWSELLRRLPALLGAPDRRVYSGVFRWSDGPADLPDAGVWIDAADASVPEWLRPFGAAEQRRLGGYEVLIARHEETGAYLAGVGIKRHDEYGWEIAVGTEPEARGRGLARALVAQAARRILDEGAVPTYQHDPANIASARVAEAAGFPDRGWRSAGMA
jgi:RimJ/RimL family protein N-acetyltransferase